MPSLYQIGWMHRPHLPCAVQFLELADTVRPNYFAIWVSLLAIMVRVPVPQPKQASGFQVEYLLL